MSRGRGRACGRLLIAGWLVFGPSVTSAGDVVLKNGTVLNGAPAPLTQLPTGPTGASKLPTTVYPILMVSNDLVQYFVPSRQVESADRGGEVQPLETFHFEAPSRARNKALGALGGFLEIKPWDAHGRRGVTLSTSAGPLPVIQAITQLTAEHARVEGVNLFWRTAVATSSMPLDQLDPILRQAVKPNNPDERLKIVRFYIQAQQFDRAQAELDQIRSDFPELEDRCRETGLNLTQRRAQMILDELQLRQAAGQYRLAYSYALKFPRQDVSASIVKEADEFLNGFETRREQAERVVVLLGEFQSMLTDSAQAAEVAPLRAEIAERLHPDTMDRLDAFLRLSNAPNLQPSEKLALALSGWVVGSANAVTDLSQALNLWRARFYIRDYLRTARDGSAERARALSQLQSIEGIGPKTVAQILPLLPPFFESPEIVPGQISRVEVSGTGDGRPVAYSVLLPLEYSTARSYPVIVALHGVQRTPASEIEFWGGTAAQPGQAQRHGYIVIAPEYLEEGARAFDYSAASQTVILESLLDCRRRFNVDSDRIFLAGHAAGGDAVFDLAMSHPDLFAGAIPMGGVADKICNYIWENGRMIPWYILVGELDRGSVMQNPRNVARMLEQGYDLIYGQYVGAGADSYYAEIHRLFAWMNRTRRAKYEKGQPLEFQTLRACDTSLHWLTFDDLPQAILQMPWLGGGRVKAMTVKAKVNEGNVLLVDSRAGRHTAFLSPEFVDFEQRLSVRLNGRQKSNEFPKPDIGVMLEDFYFRADRQRLSWAAISF